MVSANNRVWQVMAGLLVSLALLLYVVLSVEWQQVLAHLSELSPAAFVPVLALLVLHFYLRALRWRYLLPAPHQAPIRPLYDAIMLGNFASYIFPLRAGEFVRPWLLSRDYKCSFASAFASVVVERFFDLSCVLICFALVVFVVPGIPDWVFSGAMALSFLAAAILAFIVLGSFFPEMISRLIAFMLKPLPERAAGLLRRFLMDLLSGVAVLKSPKNLLLVILLTALIWLSNFFSFISFFWLFGQQGSFLISVSLAVIVALAVAAPSAPGFIGVYEGSLVAGMQLFGLSAELGAAYALISHAVFYLVFFLYAVFYLWQHSMKISDLRRS